MSKGDWVYPELTLAFAMAAAAFLMIAVGLPGLGNIVGGSLGSVFMSMAAGVTLSAWWAEMKEREVARV